MFKPDLHQGAFFQAQVAVGFGHATDSPKKVLHLDFERGHPDHAAYRFLIRKAHTLWPDESGNRHNDGVMRPSGLYQCVQCRQVFSHIHDWRDGLRQ